MSLDPKNSSKPHSCSDVELLKKEFEQITAARHNEEQKFAHLSMEMNNDLSKRQKLECKIHDSHTRHLFNQLCKINKDLNHKFINIVGCDEAGKIWFLDVITDSNNTSQAVTPERMQVDNFIKEFKGEWIEAYFRVWDKGNDFRIQNWTLRDQNTAKKDIN